MKKTFTLGILLSGTLFANEPKVYIDMSPVLFDYSNNETTTDFKPTGFKWTAGYMIQDFDFISFGLEGSLLLGVNNDTKSNVHNSQGASFTNAKVNIDKMYALHLKSVIPIVQDLNANLYFGGTRGKILSSSEQSNSENSYETSISYGLGLEYWSSADVSVYANYMQYFKNLNAVEIGVGFRF